MRKHVSAAHVETRPVLDEASELMSQKRNAESKRQLLQAFNNHFIVSEDDIAILTSTVEPVDDRFFSVLDRAKRIQVDCEILLGAENQRLGQEIMDQTTKNINGAFQKLYRWIQKEFKALNLENPQISSSIRRALRVLAERPSLFQSCLDFFAEAREHVLSDAFYSALTGSKVDGDEDKSIKPINLVAHDPLRYIGDMLAWTHSATVSEREALESMFISEGDEIAKGIQAGRDNELWSRYAEEEVPVFNAIKALNDLVDKDIAGIAQVLRQKIAQVVQSHEETILAYKIANLLNFYRITFSKLLGDGSALLDTLKSLEEASLRQFQSLIGDTNAALQSESHQVSRDLSPPDFLQDGLKQLSALMKTYDSSFSVAPSREEEFRPVLKAALEPYIAATDAMAVSLAIPEKQIFSINCWLSAKTVLSIFSFTAEHVSHLQEKTQLSSAELVEYQYSFFLQSSGISAVIQAIRNNTGLDDDLLSTEAFKPQVLTSASQILDDFLPSGLMDAMENLKHLQSATLAREITEEAADRFCEDFETVEEKLVAVDELTEHLQNGDEDGDVQHSSLRALFPRTSGEIRVLLS